MELQELGSINLLHQPAVLTHNDEFGSKLAILTEIILTLVADSLTRVSSPQFNEKLGQPSRGGQSAILSSPPTSGLSLAVLTPATN